ncbi:EamA family transporter, partial [Streptomyces sp. NPDC005070]
LLVPVFGMSSAALFLHESISPLRWGAAPPRRADGPRRSPAS